MIDPVHPHKQRVSDGLDSKLAMPRKSARTHAFHDLSRKRRSYKGPNPRQTACEALKLFGHSLRAELLQECLIVATPWAISILLLPLHPVSGLTVVLTSQQTESRPPTLGVICFTTREGCQDGSGMERSACWCSTPPDSTLHYRYFFSTVALAKFLNSCSTSLQGMNVRVPDQAGYLMGSLSFSSV